MYRAITLTLLLTCLSSCQLPPERVPPPMLPENSPPVSYAELLTRARQQATAATEAFYVNQWTVLEDAAKGLEQTARFLGKATEVPPNHKAVLPTEADDLAREAAKLRGAAVAKEVKQTNDILQHINLKVRELRLAD